MYLCGVRGTLLVSCTVSACAPVAALSTMFATKYKMDAELSASTVTVSTLLSVVTMTLIVGLATILA
jgi:predicted permease